MGLFKKKKEPEEVEAEVQLEDYDKPAKKEEKHDEPANAVPTCFLGDLALSQQIAELDEKVKKLSAAVDELLKLAKS